MVASAPPHCPACGGPNPATAAPTGGGLGPCRYCGAPLVPVGAPDPRHSGPCPSCHAPVADTDNFCGACGTRVVRGMPAVSEHELICPGCGGPTEHHSIAGGHPVDACRRCGGVWAPRATVEAVIEAARARPAPAGAPATPAQSVGVGKIEYRRCPVCESWMARRNFARISGVILDECHKHGTYFDHGELPALVAFIRGGGLERAQRRELDELARERARIEQPSAKVPTRFGPMDDARSAGRLDLVSAFVGWIVWWDR